MAADRLDRVPGIWHVQGNYFLGNAKGAAQTVPKGMFSHVINCAPKECSYAVPSGTQYVALESVDLKPADLVSLAHSVRSGTRILVHCFAGRVRSPTILRILLDLNCSLPDKTSCDLIVSAKEGDVGFLSIAYRLAKAVPQMREQLSLLP